MFFAFFPLGKVVLRYTIQGNGFLLLVSDFNRRRLVSQGLCHDGLGRRAVNGGWRSILLPSIVGHGPVDLSESFKKYDLGYLK